MSQPITDTPPNALPRLGTQAPDFEAVTTQGNLALGDFRGSWLVLFSHPADFTPVCTTEFLAFAEAHPRFRALECELLGLSIDSIYAHLAWMKRIEEVFGTKIGFPVIADHDRKVATLYGMLSPGDGGTEASRCVFVIDPGSVIRAMIYYPLTTGRNVEEILRLVEALRMTDAQGVATPANWRPGEAVILPAPRTREDLEAREAAARAGRIEQRDWFFATRKP